MLIKDWMTKDPIVVQPESSIMKAAKKMKENNIRRLPVVDESGKLVGIVSDRDIKEASPSKATTLDMHELYYLLSEIKVGDIMTKKPLTVRAEDTMEKAAVILMRNHIGGLPVIDADDKVVGVVTDSDVFTVLVRITGALYGGLQFAFDLPDAQGSLKAVLDDFKAADARIVSILTSYEQSDAGRRHVYIRIKPLADETANEALLKKLKDKYDLLYFARDDA